MKTALLLLFLAGPLWAQTFESQSAQASALLQQHKQEKASGVKTPWNTRDKASLAGDAWLEAARLAGSDAQRFQAYESAGLAYADSQNLSDDAVKAFRQARDVAGAAGADRARAGILAARRTRTRAEWEAVAALAGATPQQLATVYSEIGLTYLQPAKTEPALNLKVVEYYEKAAQQMAQYDAQAADTQLGMATVLAQSIPDGSVAAATEDRLYKTLLALPLSPDQKALRNARLEISWGSSLEKVKAFDRAIALWEGAGRKQGYAAEYREEAWIKAAELLQKLGKIDHALADLQAATPLRADNYVFSSGLAQKKLDLLDAHKRWADSLKVVEALARHPKLPAEHREPMLISRARYLLRLGKSKEAAAVLTPCWQNPARGGTTIQEIALLRAQDAVDRKDFARARLEIDAGLARLRELKASTQQLEYTSARLYSAQKQYLKAVEAYAACCTTAQLGVAPSDQLWNEVRQMFNLALSEKRVGDAQAMVQALTSWRIDPIYPPLLQAQLAAASGDAPGARASLARCRQELKRFYGLAKENLEKELAALEAGLR